VSNYAELVGYAASLTLMISFLMKDVIKLRLINTLGCSLFVAYGFLLNTSWPIIITNGFIFVVNIWHLIPRTKPALSSAEGK
jgi:hypothetical protein